MIILGIETSCDETAAAVVLKNEKGIHILSNIVSSSALLLEKYGGVLPEEAAREQLKVIIPVIEKAIECARLTLENIDRLAVTEGPGLIGSLLVGTETAKTLAKVLNKPLIPVNHLLGHLYANWIGNIPSFPCIGLLVSGGHTDLIYFKSHYSYEYLGGTRDDAAGECFDKCARLLNFPYPGGPKISESAKGGNPAAFNLPRPMMDADNFEFSFSGLKTAFANLFRNKNKSRLNIPDLCASLEQAIVEVLVTKTIQAVKKYKISNLIIAGGVAANKKLRMELTKKINTLETRVSLYIPPPNLCTDNGAMIATRAFFEKPLEPDKIQADPSLSLES